MSKEKITLGLAVLVGIITGHLASEPTPVDLSVVFERHDREVQEVSDGLRKCESDLGLRNQFIDERCVCILWGSSIEEPMTKKEICSYTPEKYNHYHSRLQSWEEK